MNKLLVVVTIMLLAGCAKYDADFYECEGDQGLVLWTCVVDTGPPTESCGDKSSGTTTKKPTYC
jgi:hypothetical protein